MSDRIFKENEGLATTMTEVMEEVDALESEQSEDALEKRMKKLESEAARLLKTSNELLQTFSKEPAKQEDIQQENSAQGNSEEPNKSEQG